MFKKGAISGSLITAVVLIIIIAAIWYFASNREVAPEMNETVVMLKNPATGVGSGTATITEEAGKAVVTIALTDTSVTLAQPAHIHTGTCAAPGDVVIPLKDVVSGSSATILNNTKAELLALTGPHLINVHKSAAEASVYIGCGELPMPEVATY